MDKMLSNGSEDCFSSYRSRHPDAIARFHEASEEGVPSTIAVAGALDSETSSDFYECALVALSRLPAGSALDLSLAGVRFISSTGVGVLTRLLAEAEGRGVALRVSNVSSACEDVFSVLGLLRYFNVPEADAPTVP